MAGETNTQRGGLHRYDIIVPAGESTKRDIRGCTIRIADTPIPVQITAHARKLNGQRGVNYTLEMRKYEKWFTDIEFDVIEIENTSELDIEVKIHAGYGDYVAEVLSRTEAAHEIRSRKETFVIPVLNANDFIEIEWFDEEPQIRTRKFGLDPQYAEVSSLYQTKIGPTGLTVPAEILALADAFTTEHFVVGAFSFYVISAENTGAVGDETLTIQSVEELYNT